MTDELTRAERLRLRFASRKPGRARFRRMPEPRGSGRAVRGQDWLAGRVLCGGEVTDLPAGGMWDLPALPDGFHDFGWLDDLVATGEARGRDLARDWTDGWHRRHGGGEGEGWDARTTGRRLARWIDHADLLMGGNERRDAALRRSVAAQSRLLGRTWRRATPGLPRIGALNGRFRALLAQGAGNRAVAPVLDALGSEVGNAIAADGSISERDPARLAALFEIVSGICADLREADRRPPEPLTRCLQVAAPVLRTLRHADGGLARFHGGGAGSPGALDRALAASRVPPAASRDRAMGYARLARGRTTLILDAAPPPGGAASRGAHASTLAFELTSGRRPLIVNCGSGAGFGRLWRLAGRSTPGHSTLVVDARSSALLSGEAADDPLDEAPGEVTLERRRDGLSAGLVASHDGYVASHGLTHIRQVFLDLDGRGLWGEDAVATFEPAHRSTFDRALADAGGTLPVRLRFHLHPDVEAEQGEGAAVELRLRSGEIWTFRHAGPADLAIERSVYLDEARLAPRPTRQIVLTAALAERAMRISWTLAKTRQTPDAVRDLVHDGRPVLA